jgi:hypothetical protein
MNPVSSLMTNPLIYQAIRDSFIVPLISNLEEDFAFIFEEDSEFKHRTNQLLSFYTLTAVPIFTNEKDDHIKLQLLNNDAYMSLMPEVVRKFIFIVLIS